MKKFFSAVCAVCLLLAACVPAAAAQTQRCPYSNESIDPTPLQSFSFYMEPGERYFRVAVYNAMPETDGDITVRIFKNGGKHPYTSLTAKPSQWTPKDSVFQASPGDSFTVMLLTSQTVKASGTVSVRVSPTDFSPSVPTPAEPSALAPDEALPALAYADLDSAPAELRDAILAARCAIVYAPDAAWSIDGTAWVTHGDGTTEVLPKFSELYPDWDPAELSDYVHSLASREREARSAQGGGGAAGMDPE